MTTTEFAALPADQRPAVVTGASSGIGEATARTLAAVGHPVVLGARRIAECERIAAEISDVGGTAYAAPLDLEDEASVTAFAKLAEDLAGPIDALVSCAGLVLPSDVLTSDRALLERHLATNVVGTRTLVQLLAVGMVQRRRGDLVFVTSDVFNEPRPGIASYVASKYAIEGLISVLKLEVEGTGVRVSTVRPGPTLTGMGWDWDPAATGEIYRSWEELGIQRHSNFMLPADVAAAVSAVVSAPPGVVFANVDVQPLAPISEPAAERGSDR